MDKVNTYCFLHVYYEELVEETMNYVNNIPSLDKLFINIPKVSDDNEDDVATEKSIKKFIPKGVKFEFFEFKNTGRDIGALLRLTKKTKKEIGKEDIVYCIHTKACQLHELGDNWRKALLDPILGDADKSSKAHDLILNNEADYVASAEKTFGYYGPNEANYHELCDRLKINLKYRLGDFTAGTIFILRQKYLDKTFSKINEKDFTDKDNHTADGLITHATERLFTTVIRSMEGRIRYV